MSARRCSLCGINYPDKPEFRECPVHEGNQTWHMARQEPDEFWDWKATELQLRSGKLPRVRGGLVALQDGSILLTGAALAANPWKPEDGDFFEAILPTPGDGEPCDCLWEVLFRAEPLDGWIVRPFHIPDYVPA